LLLEYLVTVKGWRGGVARSVATTHLVDRIARRYELPLYKTPVGFKYLADLFLKNEIIFGGEESACMAIKDHLPEKDGIFAGILVAEMMAVTGRNLVQLKEKFFREYGRKVEAQVNVPVTPEGRKKMAQLCAHPPDCLAGRKVLCAETLDGVKLDFDRDDWMLLRFSGTEPLIRLYAEADSRKELDTLVGSGLKLVS
jgi:phosphoglucomutase